MATALPSLLQQHNLSQLESHIKSEKLSLHEDDFDVNRWLDEPSLNCFPFSSNQTASSSNSNYQSNSLGSPFSFSYPSGYNYSSSNNSTSNVTSSSSSNFAFPTQTTPATQMQLSSQMMSSQLPHHQLPPMVGIPQGTMASPQSQIPQVATQFIPYNVGNCGAIPPILPGYPQMSAPQVYQLFAQFQSLFQKPPSSIIEQNLNLDDKKRRPVRTFARRVRQTRPKVVEAKGAVQCKGRNRKKGTQCRNAALMEYMGPRPIYCAEHIELDPKSLYEKCKAGYQKEPGDNKGCKEVVLKEFGLCYKHYPEITNEMIQTNNLDKALKHQQRITELLNQLEKEAAAAKRKDGDLYQRKNKLIPKFQEMKKLINSTLDQLRNRQDSDASTPASSSSVLSSDELESDNRLSSSLNSPVYQISIEDSSDLITLPDQPFSS